MYIDLDTLTLKGTNIASDPSPVKEVGNLTSGSVVNLPLLWLRLGQDRTMNLKMCDLDRHFERAIDGTNSGRF